MRLGSALIAAAASAAAIGCGFNQEGIAPPRNQIFYPGGIAVDPGEPRWLYVVNSNADLRFNDGTLAVVDLVAVHEVLTNARKLKDRVDCPSINYTNPLSGPPNYCCWDALDNNILDCDERQFIEQNSTVKIGSFGSAIQVLPTSLEGARLLVAVRGNSSITWIDAAYASLAANTAGALVCTDTPPSAGTFVECDEQHRITETPSPDVLSSPPPTQPLPEEPYSLGLDTKQLLLYVGHLRGGFLSLINLSSINGSPPELVGSFPAIFGPDLNGSVGVTSLTVTAEGVNVGRVYATSRFLPRAGAFAPISIGLETGNPETQNPKTFLAGAGDVLVSPLVGAEIRGIQVIPGTARTFLLQRTPPALVAFDTTNFQNMPTDVIEMCSGPTFLHRHSPTRGSANDMQLFVTCFESGQVYVVDPYVPKLVAIIEVGRGPAGLAFSNDNPDVAYVVGFGSNNVSVIDLDPTSETRYHVVQRIGFANPVPR